MPNKKLEQIKVFIGSPGDLSEERALFPKILEEVNKRHAKPMGILLEPVGWEDTLPGKGRAQELINEDLKTCKLVVMLLWKRWGTPTGEFSSGFEEEYELAMQDEVKEVWLYFRNPPEDMLADPGTQLKKVRKFKKKIEKEQKKERNLLYQSYDEVADWQELFTNNLCKWLDNISQPVPEPIEKEDSAARIKELEEELEKAKSEPIKKALEMVKEAWKLADSGQLTAAEENFAGAQALAEEPYVINAYGLFLKRTGSLQRAEDKFKQVLMLGEAAVDNKWQAIALGHLGIIYYTRGNLEQAEKMHRKALTINNELGSKEGMANQYGSLGNVYLTRDDLEQAEKVYQKSLAIFEELGRKEGMAAVYGNLGIIYKTRGDLEQAEKMHLKSLAINEDLRRKEGMARDYTNLGILYEILGELKKTEEFWQKSLAIYQSFGNKAEIEKLESWLAGLKKPQKAKPKTKSKTKRTPKRKK